MNLAELKLADYVECLPNIFGYPKGTKFGGFIIDYATDNDPQCIKVLGNIYGEEEDRQIYVTPDQVTKIIRRPNSLPTERQKI